MRLSFILDEPESLTNDGQDNNMTIVSGYTAAIAYNELCKMIGSRWPDAVIQEEAPFAHEFFMKLFGVMPNE